MIKPGDTLLFDVELLGFHEKAKERWEMSAAELMEEATKTKVMLHTSVCYRRSLQGPLVLRKRVTALGLGAVCLVFLERAWRRDYCLSHAYLFQRQRDCRQVPVKPKFPYAATAVVAYTALRTIQVYKCLLLFSSFCEELRTQLSTAVGI